MKTLIIFLLVLNVSAITIINKPIHFGKTRIELTKEYILKRYDLNVKDISIIPRMIVIHWTAVNDFNISYDRFKGSKLPGDRVLIQKVSVLNVSTHYLIDTNGTIYKLMDDTIMARHVIGLNYNAIGIENVGGKGNIDNLTPAQLKSNIELISYLKDKHQSVDYLIGHHEYSLCTDNPLWMEKDKKYRTKKYDPGENFMQKLRVNFPSLRHCKKSVNDK